MNNRNLYDQVDKALKQDDWNTARSLLEPIADNGDIDAKIYLGTVLTLSPDINSYNDGVSLLRDLAENGNGHAAHNLATALSTGIGATDETRSECVHFMQIAVDSGFEKTVSSDPLWWKKSK